MSFWLRAVLSWLLALALPMQGVAAATMLHCAEARTPAVHARAADLSMASASHHHHHRVMSAVAASAKTDTQIASTEAKCSVCAACCLATALPVAMRSFDATVPAESFAPVMARVDPVFLTGGPERPPRPLLV